MRQRFSDFIRFLPIMYLPIVRTRMDSDSFPYAETDDAELAICHISEPDLDFKTFI